MKRFYVFFGFLATIILTLAMISNANAQTGGTETYTGTVLSYGSGFNTRSVTRTFTLTINKQTSNAQAQ